MHQSSTYFCTIHNSQYHYTEHDLVSDVAMKNLEKHSGSLQVTLEVHQALPKLENLLSPQADSSSRIEYKIIDTSSCPWFYGIIRMEKEREQLYYTRDWIKSKMHLFVLI